MKIYLLKASGPLAFFPSSTGTPMCSTAFRSREKAEAHKEHFIKKCTIPMSDDDLGVLEKVAKVMILEIEIELEDEETP